jgi:hypothetical protein
MSTRQMHGIRPGMGNRLVIDGNGNSTDQKRRPSSIISRMLRPPSVRPFRNCFIASIVRSADCSLEPREKRVGNRKTR